MIESRNMCVRYIELYGDQKKFRTFSITKLLLQPVEMATETTANHRHQTYKILLCLKSICTIFLSAIY